MLPFLPTLLAALFQTFANGAAERAASPNPSTTLPNSALVSARPKFGSKQIATCYFSFANLLEYLLSRNQITLPNSGKFFENDDGFCSIFAQLKV